MNRKPAEIRAVCLDLDGTLLPHSKELSKATQNALIALQEKGVTIILATGRNLKEALPLAEKLRCPDFGGWLIFCNGQQIHSFQNQKTPEGARISQADALTLVKLAEQFPVMITVEQDGQLIQTRNPFGWWALIKRFSKQLRSGRWIFNQLKGRSIRSVGKIAPYIQSDLSKISFSGSSAALQRLSLAIERQFPKRFARMLVMDTWLEIMDISVSKGAAMETISALTRIPLEQFLAFGDGENDLSMIEKAGWGVAMRNAMPALKAACDEISERDCDHDGVLWYLKKIGLCE